MEKELYMVDVNGYKFVMEKDEYHKLMLNVRGDVRLQAWGEPVTIKSAETVMNVLESWYGK